MAIKDILLPLVGKPGAAAIAAIEKSTAVAGATRSASGWPTAASTTRPSGPSCWPPPPTRAAPTPRSAWGCSTCRSAARTRPRDLFDAAFAADPFNVRADNMMKVLKHMASYTPVETEHYSVLVDPKQDDAAGQVHGAATSSRSTAS